MSLFNRVSGQSRGASTNSDRPICKFYTEGRCRYGEGCNNYHPPRDQGSNRSSNLPYHLSKDAIKADLTYGEERPTWPLSAYGPGKDAPRQLLDGTIEQSPEELRVQYYLAKGSGSGTQQYEQEERNALDLANQQVQRIANDLDGALKFVIEGKDVHPNRDDGAQKASESFRWTEKPSFDQNASSSGASGSTFGQSSAFGAGSSPSAFGQPSAPGQNTAFGQSSTNTSTFGGGQSGGSAFGRPSSLGGGSTAFGQPSALGGGSTAFGQPSSLGGGSTPFGKPSALGSGSPFGTQNPTSNTSTFGQTSSTTGGSTFGQSSTPGSGTTFGKPSPFGAGASSTTPAFGQTGFGSATTSTSTFGQAGQQQSPFGQASQPGSQASPFGQVSQSGPQASPFGQPSQPDSQTSAFGQPSQPSTFGQPSQAGQQQSSTFGKPSPFGGSSNAGSAPPFGQSTFGSRPSPFDAAVTTNKSPFGQPPAPSQQPQQQSPFGSTSGQQNGFGRAGTSTTPFGSGTQQQQSNTTRQPGQPLTTFKGHAVAYNDRLPFYKNPNTGKLERIWLPDGAPGPNADVEAANSATYEGALGAALKEIYDFVREQGMFKDGVMPEIPPKREWVGWDL